MRLFRVVRLQILDSSFKGIFSASRLYSQKILYLSTSTTYKMEGSSFTAEEFSRKHLELLSLEREEEIKQNESIVEGVSLHQLQRLGVALARLVVTGQRMSHYGRVIVTLSAPHKKELPSHNFTTGDIAALHRESDRGEDRTSGVITAVTANSISLALDSTGEKTRMREEDIVGITRLANNVTYKHLKTALQSLEKHADDNLVRVLFGLSSPGHSYADFPELVWFNSRLDRSQKEAVAFALSQRELAVIHGPPGTGKTTTLVEIICQAVKRFNLKVLACAPSNVAVDNLTERVCQAGLRAVRLGHPARSHGEAQKNTLDALVAQSEEREIIEDVRSDIDRALGLIKDTGGGKTKRRVGYEDLRLLKKELKERSEKVSRSILKGADVVLSTLTSASPGGPLRVLEQGAHFDLCIVDECSQSLEAACWVALPHVSRCILAGDHFQLPPTILSEKAASSGLSLSLMERLLSLYPASATAASPAMTAASPASAAAAAPPLGPTGVIFTAVAEQINVVKAGKGQISRTLTVQYRMNSKIMQWASDALYGGVLEAADSVSHHLLSDMDGVKSTEDTSACLVLIDTAGCDMGEMETDSESSKGNEGEALLVGAHVRKLVDSGVQPSQIAVISPYNLQVELIRSCLGEKLSMVEVRSVDGFQGREKEAVVISLVRSNSKGEVGFLREDRRLNVAVTRARRHLAIICDSTTVGRHQFLNSLITYITTEGDVRSAAEYQQDAAFSLLGVQPLVQTDSNGSKRNPRHMLTAAAAQHKTRKGGKLKPEVCSSPSTRQAHSSALVSTTRTTPRSAVHSLAEDQMAHEAGEAEKLNIVTEELQRFLLQDDLMQKDFPSTFSSYQRRLLHEMAEESGLQHESIGAGIERFCRITKPGPTVDETAVSEGSEITIDDKNTASAQDVPSLVEYSNVVCEYTDRLLEDTNTQSGNTTKGESCAKIINGAQSNVKVPSRKKRNKTKKSQKRADSATEDFDTLVDEATKESYSCSMTGCKISTRLIRETCRHCVQSFCLSHALPEIHGCGIRAKTAARQQICRDGVLYEGSGVPSKKPDPTKRSYMKKALNKRLGELAASRSSGNKKQ